MTYSLRQAEGSLMDPQRDASAWGQNGETLLALLHGDKNYPLLTDDQLLIERDRLRDYLEALTVNPGSSPAVCQLLVNIEHEIEHMMDELLQRARSRHPSSGGLGARQRLQLVLLFGLLSGR
jgi:hypothetical protein